MSSFLLSSASYSILPKMYAHIEFADNLQNNLQISD